MHRNSSMLVAALAATGLLTLPAGALAAGTVFAGPVKVKGYSVSLTATDGAAADGLSVFAVKSSRGSQQMHSWSFTGVAVTVKGGKATIKGNLGAFGKVNAKVAAVRKVKGAVPPGCKGTAGTVRKGTMKGATKLVLDSSFFRTLAPKRLPAQIAQAGKLDCSGAGAGGGTGGSAAGLMLMSSATTADGHQLMVNIVKQGAKISQTVMRTDKPASGASVFHMISAKAGASGLTAAADLGSATAAAAGPFLSGTLAFTGEPMGTMASGTISGDFAARFDSIGTQTLPAGNDGMLMQR